MQQGGGAMQQEHILEIAAHVLDMVAFIMLEIAKKCFTKMSKEKKKKLALTIAEKSWILDHAEKNKSLSGARLVFDFTAKFGRPIHKTTITRILKQKNEIRQINATTIDLNTSKVHRISTSVFQFQSELAEKPGSSSYCNVAEII